MTRYTARPSANRASARIAWDYLARKAAIPSPRTILVLWFAREMEAWCAELDDGEYIEVDQVVVADRKNNPKKYASLSQAATA